MTQDNESLNPTQIQIPAKSFNAGFLAGKNQSIILLAAYLIGCLVVSLAPRKALGSIFQVGVGVFPPFARDEQHNPIEDDLEGRIQRVAAENFAKHPDRYSPGHAFLFVYTSRVIRLFHIGRPGYLSNFSEIDMITGSLNEDKENYLLNRIKKFAVDAIQENDDSAQGALNFSRENTSKNQVEVAQPDTSLVGMPKFYLFNKKFDVLNNEEDRKNFFDFMAFNKYLTGCRKSFDMELFNCATYVRNSLYKLGFGKMLGKRIREVDSPADMINWLQEATGNGANNSGALRKLGNVKEFLQEIADRPRLGQQAFYYLWNGVENPEPISLVTMLKNPNVIRLGAGGFVAAPIQTKKLQLHNTLFQFQDLNRLTHEERELPFAMINDLSKRQDDYLKNSTGNSKILAQHLEAERKKYRIFEVRLEAGNLRVFNGNSVENLRSSDGKYRFDSGDLPKLMYMDVLILPVDFRSYPIGKLVDWVDTQALSNQNLATAIPGILTAYLGERKPDEREGRKAGGVREAVKLFQLLIEKRLNDEISLAEKERLLKVQLVLKLVEELKGKQFSDEKLSHEWFVEILKPLGYLMPGTYPKAFLSELGYLMHNGSTSMPGNRLPLDQRPGLSSNLSEFVTRHVSFDEAGYFRTSYHEFERIKTSSDHPSSGSFDSEEVAKNTKISQDLAEFFRLISDSEAAADNSPTVHLNDDLINLESIYETEAAQLHIKLELRNHFLRLIEEDRFEGLKNQLENAKFLSRGSGIFELVLGAVVVIPWYLFRWDKLDDLDWSKKILKAHNQIESIVGKLQSGFNSASIVLKPEFLLLLLSAAGARERLKNSRLESLVELFDQDDKAIYNQLNDPQFLSNLVAINPPSGISSQVASVYVENLQDYSGEAEFREFLVAGFKKIHEKYSSLRSNNRISTDLFDIKSQVKGNGLSRELEKKNQLQNHLAELKEDIEKSKPSFWKILIEGRPLEIDPTFSLDFFNCILDRTCYRERKELLTSLWSKIKSETLTRKQFLLSVIHMDLRHHFNFILTAFSEDFSNDDLKEVVAMIDGTGHCHLFSEDSEGRLVKFVNSRRIRPWAQGVLLNCGQKVLQ